MSKSFAEITRHPARFGVILMIAVAVAMLALVISRIDTSAVHELQLIQLDTHVGPIGNCTTANTTTGLCDAANTTTGLANDAATGYDWNDICQRNSITGRIEVKPSLPAVFVSGTASCIPDFMNPDHTYFQSNKDIQNIAPDPSAPVKNTTTWACGAQANVLAKDDILNAYAVEGISPVNGHHAFYFGIERASNTGTAYQGFWFLQRSASCVAPTSTAVPFSGGPHVSGCHTPCTPDHIGDILVLINYTGGGKVSTVQAYEWCPSSVVGCTPGSSDPLQLVSNGASCAALSPTAVDQLCAVTNNTVLTPGSQTALAAANNPGAWDNTCSASTTCPSESAQPLGLNQFFEGGIDLNALLCPSPTTTPTPAPTSCNIPCFSTFLSETRSSAEFSATLKDYAGASANSCSAAIAVKKTDAAGNLLNGACFTFTDSAGTLIATVCDGGTGDKSGAAGVADGIVCIDGLGSGIYTVHETVAPGGYSVDQGADKTITVTGPLASSTICPNATADHTVTLVDPLGSISVKKTDVAGNLLTGATFKVTPNPFYCTSGTPGGTPSPKTNPGTGSATVTDGVTTAASGTQPDVTVPDTDVGSANGTVTLTGVCLGTYTIEETIAPAGYSLDPVTNHQRSCVVADTGVTATEQKCTVVGVATPGVTFVDPLGTLTINKVDSAGNLITVSPGATFTITPNVFACYQPTAGTNPSPITDGGATDPDGLANGIIALTGVCIPNTTGHVYTVTETTAPAGYIKDPTPQTCTVADTGVPATEQNCTVTFTNTRDSLIIRKEAKNANTTCPAGTPSDPGCHDLLGGATFTITPNPFTRTAGSSLTIKDNALTPATDQFGTTDGVVCLDSVLVGSYTIQEVAPFPANYAPDTSSPTVAASVGSCASRTSGATPAKTPTTVVPDVTFTNTPLSAIEVQCDSVAGPGVTRCSIVCTGQTADSDTTNPGDNLGENGAADPAFDDTHEIFTSLVPGTYNCQVVIDP